MGRARDRRALEGLRFPAMVFGIIGGIMAFFSIFADLLQENSSGAIAALILTVILFATAAMTPSLPGWSAAVYIGALIIPALWAPRFR